MVKLYCQVYYNYNAASICILEVAQCGETKSLRMRRHETLWHCLPARLYTYPSLPLNPTAASSAKVILTKATFISWSSFGLYTSRQARVGFSEISMEKRSLCDLEEHCLPKKLPLEESDQRVDDPARQTENVDQTKKQPIRKSVVHAPVFSYQCDLCNYSSKHKWTVIQHKAARHNIGVVWYKCRSCEYKAKRKSSITRHEANASCNYHLGQNNDFLPRA